MTPTLSTFLATVVVIMRHGETIFYHGTGETEQEALDAAHGAVVEDTLMYGLSDDDDLKDELRGELRENDFGVVLDWIVENDSGVDGAFVNLTPTGRIARDPITAAEYAEMEL